MWSISGELNNKKLSCCCDSRSYCIKCMV